MEMASLEGFVLAITPFNLQQSAATRQPRRPCVVMWWFGSRRILKYILHKCLCAFYQEAGLPDGVINLIYVDGPVLGKICFSHRDFVGVHFTGSTGVFNYMWKAIGENMGN